MNYELDLPSEIRFISLCSGGGGLDLGLELAIPNARAVVCVERESFAIAHLVSAMEEGFLAPTPIWTDVRSFDGRRWRGKVDGLIGGIPCQSHSLAGRKLGQFDERDLWSPTRRIVAQARPWWVLIENVAGMLSPGADSVAGAERVWRDLRKLGFQVEGGLFTASEVGASHQRERIFILGVADYALCGWGDECSSGQGGQPAGTHRGGSGELANSNSQQGRRQFEIGSGHREKPRQEFDRSSIELADANGERLEGIGSDSGEIGRQDARGQAGLRDGATLVHAERSERRSGDAGGYESDRDDTGRDQATGRLGEPGEDVGNAASERSFSAAQRGVRGGEEGTGSRDEEPERSGGQLVNPSLDGRGEGRAEPEVRSGRDSSAGAGGSVADSDIPEFRGDPSDGEFTVLQQDDGHGGISGQERLADAHSDESATQRGNSGEVPYETEGEGRAEYGAAVSGGCGFTPLDFGTFPPGPGDFERWREIVSRWPHLSPAISAENSQSTLRGMAHELADRIYGDSEFAEEIRSSEALSCMWEAVVAQAFWGQTGRPFTVSQSEILRQIMYGCWNGEIGRSSDEESYSEEVCFFQDACLRGMQLIRGFASTPQRQELEEQFTGQFSDIVRYLSHYDAPSEWGHQSEAGETTLRRMWEAFALELRASLQHLQDQMEEVQRTRIDRLRLLGNGVVCLEAAYAIRVLATRLAARGSIGADVLVRMIERDSENL